MKSMTCEHCGSAEFLEDGNKLTCLYCRSTYEKEPVSKGFATTIGVQSDVEVLLQKCRKDPAKAARYANRIFVSIPSLHFVKLKGLFSELSRDINF